MKRTTVLFIQGGGEGAYEADKKLVAYLEKALRKNYEIIYPKMPDENDPDYKIFKATIEGEIEKINHDLLLIGHSLGGCFLLKYSTEKRMSKNILGLFLIATPFWGEGGWQYEGFTIDNKLAAEKTKKIQTFFYHSTNDEIVPFSHLQLYKEKFPHAKMRKISGRGHQLQNDLSEVVDDIKVLMSES